MIRIMPILLKMYFSLSVVQVMAIVKIQGLQPQIMKRLEHCDIHAVVQVMLMYLKKQLHYFVRFIVVQEPSIGQEMPNVYISRGMIQRLM